MTKTIRPISVGETRDDPTRSMLCLKAWTLWRARNVARWLGVTAARQRAFEEEADLLYMALRGLQPQSDGVLGNETATDFFKTCLPGAVFKLFSYASGGLASGGPGGAHASPTLLARVQPLPVQADYL